ncbi:IPTL-CTERM sorting domain-containing protein [Wenzhouxiangella sp. XN79A]|uniref:IPTL-CTERM sorting domain-containing protein n=1 Tax=Wenzhouxiangella sp. XN79A TaxID=2724193 RepID=UPI00144AEF73|nr:IPTL-CTERM sorting domain-containing protein [Wenzhouxiangella sp. XN79A]NKI34156.1 IPTL-CTERM sorting domain-containing protein [Wenzhouxiangella sp. XN79A]
MLSQIITTTGSGPLEVSWWANNELTDPRPGTNVYQTAVQFNDLDGNFLAWSEFRDGFDPDALTWAQQSYTTTIDFAPGSYEVVFFIGGLMSADDLVVSQGMRSVPVPTLSPVSLVLLVLGLGLVAAVVVRRRATRAAG